jgi:ABC-type spermidine/putrescine transport system permease subunit II
VFLRCRAAGGSTRIRPPHVSLELLSAPRLVALALATLLGLALTVGPLFALFYGALSIGAVEQITNANLAALADAALTLEVDALEAVRRSALLIVVSVAVSLPIGFVAAVVIAPLRDWPATLIEGALLLPLALPVVLAAGLRAGGFGSPSWLLFIHFAIVFPLVVRAVLPGARVRTYVEAATVLGASRWTSWRRRGPPRWARISCSRRCSPRPGQPVSWAPR